MKLNEFYTAVDGNYEDAMERLQNEMFVVKFLRILRMEGGLCIGMRSVSLSTCGLVENMRRS